METYPCHQPSLNQFRNHQVIPVALTNIIYYFDASQVNKAVLFCPLYYENRFYSTSFSTWTYTLHGVCKGI